MFKSKQKGITSFELIIFTLWVSAIGGWIANIVKFVGMIGENEVTTMFLARLVGIPVGPLGAVLGYF